MDVHQIQYQGARIAARHVQLLGALPFDPETSPARVDRDWPLVAALRQREPTAAERLVATYGDRAYRLAIGITGSRQDAEEAIQDAFWSVVRKIDTFRGESGFGSWLYRIVANAAYGTLRRGYGRRLDRSLDEALPLFDEQGRPLEPITDRSPRVDDPSVQSELRTVLTAALAELPLECRAVVVLRDVEGLSYREIGEVLGITVPSARARVHRARLFLRKRLAGYMAAGSGVPAPRDWRSEAGSRGRGGGEQ
jgi:RNA polymerase sigma-70 factor, ECF subfamily